ncbi:MAG TPA: hypothetical protein VKK31_31290, partial [Thermoanaerobaculia bacterium]|nr:hypothetical protein [Thermoanaerobaculia bacterium]
MRTHVRIAWKRGAGDFFVRFGSELVKKSRVLSWTVEAPGVEEAGQGRGVPPCGWDVEGLEGKPDFLR